ncbi:MAG: peptidylprolyl isomerase [Minicystis sp.]
MQRWTAFLFATLTASFLAAVVIVGRGPKAVPVAAGAADAGADAARDASKDGAEVSDGGEPADAEPGDDPPLAVGPGGEPLPPTTDAGATLISGEAPPGLAADAPKSVVFGVILVQYKGAQGAPSSAKPRDAALELAKQLAGEAKEDFKATVAKVRSTGAKGDREGSMDNAGRIPRGMLEPAPEYVLFSLPKDGVSEPVDTPRGFWIVHRIE